MKQTEKLKVLAQEIASRKEQIKIIESEIKRFEDFLADVDNVNIDDNDIEYVGEKDHG